MKKRLLLLFWIVFLLSYCQVTHATQTDYAQQVDFILAGLTDANGVPLNAGKVYTYQIGTTTLQTTWTDRAKTTAQANPVILDAYGKAQIYVSGWIKFVIQDSTGAAVATVDNVYYEDIGTPIFIVDNYTSLANAITAIGSTTAVLQVNGNVTVNTAVTIPSNIALKFINGGLFTKSGTGSLTINSTVAIEAGYYQIFSGFSTVTFGNGYSGVIVPQWFGVVDDWNGSSGTDNSTNLASAFNSVPAGGTLFIPPVVNKAIGYSTGVTMGSVQAMSLRGEGNASVLKFTGTGTALTVSGYHAQLNNIILIGNSSAAGAILLDNNEGGTMRNVYVFGTGGVAFDYNGRAGMTAINCGADHNMQVIGNSILTSGTWGGDPSITFRTKVSGGNEAHRNIWINCFAQNSAQTGTGWEINSGQKLSIIGCTFQNLTTGIHVVSGASNPAYVSVVNPWFESSSVTTPIIDDYVNSWGTGGIGELYQNVIGWAYKNVNGVATASAGLASTGTSKNNIPLLMLYDDNATHATGYGIIGDSKTGCGILGRLTAPIGGVAANEDFAGVEGKVLTNNGIAVRGRGFGESSYAGYFENGLFFTSDTVKNVRSVSGSYSFTQNNDEILFVNASGAATTTTLPSSPATGMFYTVMKTDSSGNVVTISGNGKNINGVSTASLTAQYKYTRIIFDGTQWFVVGSN